MKYVDKCAQCGKEYKPTVNEAPDENPKCDACGAELIERDSHSTFDVDAENEDEHLVEKGLRKVTDGITGKKT
ncbi:hypothetical protein QT231_01255 [Halomonas sp. SpR1]|uniref:hypothetical protein n=1 Tax=Halomonas sp. SpR1 TaxID=3050462 RepID=UPI0027E3B31E|nr:hypothetical protein [Halomonas sp. SpR1]MDQ7731306.1 hypothetical protein [Halomonas sp. SpR1]